MIKGFSCSRLVVALFVLVSSSFLMVGRADATIIDAGSFLSRGFIVSSSEGENAKGAAWAGFSVGSGQHRIDTLASVFYTLSSDTSEAIGILSIGGVRSSGVSLNPLNSSFDLDIGGVKVSQSMGLYSYVDAGMARNVGFIDFWSQPFDLESTSLQYYELPMQRFRFDLVFSGSFGEGAEGDLRGLPFAQSVPTPSGLMALVGFVALACIGRSKKPF